MGVLCVGDEADDGEGVESRRVGTSAVGGRRSRSNGTGTSILGFLFFLS